MSSMRHYLSQLSSSLDPFVYLSFCVLLFKVFNQMYHAFLSLVSWFMVIDYLWINKPCCVLTYIKDYDNDLFFDPIKSKLRELKDDLCV